MLVCLACKSCTTMGVVCFVVYEVLPRAMLQLAKQLGAACGPWAHGGPMFLLAGEESLNTSASTGCTHDTLTPKRAPP